MNVTSGLLTLIGSQWFPTYGDGVPDAPGARYAALWVAPGVLTAADLCGTPDVSTERFQVTGVGRGPAEAVAVAVAVRDAIVGRAPVVPGWEHALVAHYASQPPRRDDDDPTGTVWIATDQYECRATRTP